ncbi:MAG: lysylphosphatidylglycerol synthase domain-containing protein [Thermoguttaceae bacterium]|nr:lysylphosphatidylglycerol synthase domain-containing protein [Thermoguttaceae bacterium]
MTTAPADSEKSNIQTNFHVVSTSAQPSPCSVEATITVEPSAAVPSATAPTVQSSNEAVIPKRRSRRTRWMMWMKLAIMLLIAGGLYLAVRKSLHLLDENDHGWNFQPWWLISATFVYTLSLFPSGLFYWLGMRGLGQHPSLYRSVRSYYIGHLGKYVPGKAMVPVLRAALVCGPRVTTAAAVAAVFLETLTWIASGAFWGVAYLIIAYRSAWQTQPWLLFAAVGVVVGAALPTLPPVFRFALTLLQKCFPRKAESLSSLKRLNFRTLGLGWICSSVVWWGMGAAYWLVLRSMNVGIDYFPISTLPFCMMTISLAISISFLILPLPGGLGLRETVIYALMTTVFFAGTTEPEIARSIAALSAVLFRLISLGGEVGVSVILYLIRPPRETMDETIR